MLYDLPFGKSRRFKFSNSIVDAIAGGWGINMINTMTSGLPLNITYGPTTQASVSSLTTPRPNLTGAPIYLATGNPINLSNAAGASRSAQLYTQPWGNAARNIVHSPAFYNFDFGLHKNFSLFSESRFLQVRAEAFNLLNKTNFAPPGTLSANSGGFGVFSQTFPARQVQLALKFTGL